MSTTHLLTIALDENTDPVIADNLTEIVHQLIPGSHTVDSMTIDAELTDFEWDDEDGHPALPLSEAAARELMTEDGLITIVTTVDQDSFMDQRAYGRTTKGADDESDLLHARAFSFGQPYDCSTVILAVQDASFVVSYTTRIGEFITSTTSS